MTYRYWAIIVMLGTLILAPLALGLEGMLVITRPETWARLFAIGFVLASAAFIILVWLVPRVGGTTASTITLIPPISSIWLGVFSFGCVAVRTCDLDSCDLFRIALCRRAALSRRAQSSTIWLNVMWAATCGAQSVKMFYFMMIGEV